MITYYQDTLPSFFFQKEYYFMHWSENGWPYHLHGLFKNDGTWRQGFIVPVLLDSYIFAIITYVESSGTETINCSGSRISHGDGAITPEGVVGANE